MNETPLPYRPTDDPAVQLARLVYDGLHPSDAAAQLGIPTATAFTQLHRLREDARAWAKTQGVPRISDLFALRVFVDGAAAQTALQNMVKCRFHGAGQMGQNALTSDSGQGNN